MFGKSKSNGMAEESAEEREAHETLTRILQRPDVDNSAVAPQSKPVAPQAVSSIDPGLSIVGTIVGNGSLAIFGRVQGEVRASTVQIGDGAQVEGNIVADELTIGGHVKGTVHANRVKLNSTAVVEGDIYHRSLAIEENAQFEGMSRRQENGIDMPSLVPAKLPQSQPGSTHDERAGSFADSLNCSKPELTDGNGPSSGDLLNS